METFFLALVMLDETSHPPTPSLPQVIWVPGCHEFFVQPSFWKNNAFSIPFFLSNIIQTTISCFSKSKMLSSDRFEKKIMENWYYVYNPKSSVKDHNSKKGISSTWRWTSRSFHLIYQGTRRLKSCQISCSSVT